MIKIDEKILKEIQKLYCEKNLSGKEVAKRLGIGEYRIFKILRENNWIRSVGKTYKYTVNETYFSKIDSEEKAYWLGVIYADGNISLNNCGTGQLFISSIDEEWLKEFLKSINATHPLYQEIHKKYKKKIWKVHITNHNLYLDLLKLGIVPNKSLVLEFPNIDEKWIPHFIRGYFDGDGCVTTNKYLKNSNAITLRSEICSGSKIFLEKLLAFIPTKHKNITIRQTNLFGFRFSVNDSIIFAKYIYKDATIFLKRKLIKFENYIKQRRSTTIIDNPFGIKV